MSDMDYLVCVLADAPVKIKGSTVDRECCKCHRRVMIAPSSQAVLAAKPDLPVICIACITTLVRHMQRKA